MKETKNKNNDSKLFKKDFLLIVIGQIISLFGNTILRFALSLLVLDITGSVAIFSIILAVSMIPTILLSAFGGILADRVNKRNIMVALDFLSAALIIMFAICFNIDNSVLFIAIIMIFLSIIQSFYQPAVQSSIPLLVNENKLMSANGVVIQVNALANLIGPIIGGLIYGFFGWQIIVTVGAICFFLSAVMECFINISHIKKEKTNSIFTTIKVEFSEAVHFLKDEQRDLLKLLFLIAGLNLFLSSMIIVGLPYFIKIVLGLSNQLYGFAESAMGVGSILGGLMAGIAAKKIGFKKSYILLVAASIAIIPMGIAIISTDLSLVSYGIILISVLVCMLFSTLFTIYAQTIMQKITPITMLGKISSVVTVIAMCAMPIGQALYGLLYDFFQSKSSIVVFLAAIICIVISVLSKKVLERLKVPEENSETKVEELKQEV